MAVKQISIFVENKEGRIKKAIDTCVLMNKWNLAVELAENNNFFQIEGLVNKFGSLLLEKGKKNLTKKRI